MLPSLLRQVRALAGTLEERMDFFQKGTHTRHFKRPVSQAHSEGGLIGGHCFFQQDQFIPAVIFVFPGLVPLFQNLFQLARILI